jgi:uncharacterized protein
MDYIKRTIEPPIRHTLARGKSILLLGARQTGKTMLIRRLKTDLYLNLIQPELRQRYEQNLFLLTGEVEVNRILILWILGL